MELGSLFYKVKMKNRNFKQGMKENKREVKGFDKAIKKNKRNLKRYADGFKKVGIALTAVSAAIGGVSFKLAQAAGEAEDTQAKFDTVFTDMNKEADRFVSQFADQFDLAETSIQEWMATLKDTFDPLGVANDRSLEWGETLTALALDVKTFYPSINSVNDAIGRFTSYLVGNHEAVREMGVVVNQAMIKQEAYKTGIAETGEELSEVQKMTARYQLLLNGLENAQGNAMRELDNFNMSMTQLEETWIGFKQEFGEHIMPTVNNFVNGIKNILNYLKDLPDETQKTIVKWMKWAGIITGVVGPLSIVLGYFVQMGAVVAGAGGLTAAISGLASAFTPFLVGGAVIAGIVKLISKIKEWRDETEKIEKSIEEVDTVEGLKERRDILVDRIEQLRKQRERERKKFEAYSPRYTGDVKFKFSKQDELDEKIKKHEKTVQKLVELIKQIEDAEEEAKEKEEKDGFNVDEKWLESRINYWKQYQDKIIEDGMEARKEDLEDEEEYIQKRIEYWEQYQDAWVEKSIEAKKEEMRKEQEFIEDRIDYWETYQDKKVEKAIEATKKELEEEEKWIEEQVDYWSKYQDKLIEDSMEEQKEKQERKSNQYNMYKDPRMKNYRMGQIKGKQYEKMLDNNFVNMFNRIGYSIDQAQNKFEQFRSSLIDGITTAITEGKKLEETLKKVADQVAAMVIKKGIVTPIVDWGLSAAGMAHGGGLVTVNGIESFHTGGQVGSGPLKPDEKLIKTKVGEIILNKEQQKGVASAQQGATNNNFYIKAFDSQDVYRALTKNGVIGKALADDYNKNGTTRQVVKGGK